VPILFLLDLALTILYMREYLSQCSAFNKRLKENIVYILGIPPSCGKTSGFEDVSFIKGIDI